MKIDRFYHTPGGHPPLVGPYLPKAEFLMLHKYGTVICVDMVVRHGSEFLLVKRANLPKRGEWFVPGGRIAKNETLVGAVARKLFEETGLKGGAPKLILVTEHFNVKHYLPKGNSHIITFGFEVTVKSKGTVRVDSQSSDAKWFAEIPRTLHAYPKAMLKAAGFK